MVQLKAPKEGQLGYRASLEKGFAAVRSLDNSNMYGVMLSEMTSNVFKEGMWFKALTPYMLILTHNDPVQVGNMLSLNGLTRAVVGVFSGRLGIDMFGLETIWLVTGFIGILSILINFVCLCKGSIAAAYFLNFTWAVYNGLWNSCLETSWSKSIVRSKRKDVNPARQITNKFTTALGPLLSALIFLYCGNTWTIDIVVKVMIFGTVMTILPVMLCFCFRKSQEVEQRMYLGEVRSITFPVERGSATKEFMLKDLAKGHFQKEEMGFVKITYPIGKDGELEKKWHSRVRIVTKNFNPTDFILVKQFQSAFRDVAPDEKSCILRFEDKSRPAERVDLKSLEIYLMQDERRSVNREVSRVHFALNPSMVFAPKRFEFSRILSSIVWGHTRNELQDSPGGEHSGEDLQKPLLPENATPAAKANLEDTITKQRSMSKVGPEKAPNMLGANVIVVCDVLNAFGSGFSLKFKDLYLKVDYGVSPAGVFLVAFFQNVFAAWLTPYANNLFAKMRQHGYRTKLGVVVLWVSALFFLGMLIIPDMPLWVVLPSIVMMQSLNSCTRAYNRAQLVNYLPPDKIPKYMAWDALNKANQGGVAIFGAQLVEYGGYRGAFLGTFVIFTIRTLIYLAYTLRKGGIYKVKPGTGADAQAARRPDIEEEITAEELLEAENITGPQLAEADSQMFRQADGWVEEEWSRESRLMSEVQALPMEFALGHGGEVFGGGSRTPGSPTLSPKRRQENMERSRLMEDEELALPRMEIEPGDEVYGSVFRGTHGPDSSSASSRPK